MTNATSEVKITLQKEILNSSTARRIDFRAEIEPVGDSHYNLTYSHAPQALPTSGVYYGSLASAFSRDDAFQCFDAMCTLIEDAYRVVRCPAAAQSS